MASDALLELAARCEKATGPDRGIDKAICEALWPGEPLQWPDMYKATSEHWNKRPVLRCTSSLDAITALVREKLPGRGYSVGRSPDGMSQAAIFFPDRRRPPFEFLGDRLDGHVALALCTAFLRALASVESGRSIAQEKNNGR